MKRSIHRPAIIATILTVFLSLSGCLSYSHEHTPDGGEKTKITGLVTKTTVAGLASSVKSKQGPNSYSRTVGLESGTTTGDAETISAIAEGVARGLGKAALPIP